MLIVDSSVWIDFFRQAHTEQVKILESALLREPVGVGDIMLCEVLQGIRDDAQFERVRRQLLKLTVWPVVGPYVAMRAASNYRALRRKGIAVRKTIDTLIATFCIEEDHVLLHNDADFDGFEQHLGLCVLRQVIGD